LHLLHVRLGVEAPLHLGVVCLDLEGRLRRAAIRLAVQRAGGVVGVELGVYDL